MARAVAVEEARVVALAHCHILCHVCRLGHPRRGVGGGEGTRVAGPPRAALSLTLSSLTPLTAAATDGLPPSAAVVVPQRLCRSPFGINAVAASTAAIGADVGGATARCQRNSSSVISAAPMGVAAKRGKDPAVDGSHSGKEGGGVEDDDDDEYHEGGGEEAGAPPSLCCPLLLRRRRSRCQQRPRCSCRL